MVYADMEKNSELETSLLERSEKRKCRCDRLRQSKTKVAFVLIICCLSFLLGFNLASHLQPSKITNQEIIKTISRPSPILRDFGIQWTEVQFNGSLLKENVYRGDAGPEVDAAWKELGVDYHAIIIPSYIAESIGMDSDQVQLKEKYGGGYPANIEGLHHLHCLNLLRQTLHWNYPYYQSLGQGAFKNEPFIVKKHSTHCLDILRQQLMCTVDIGVMGQIWWQPHGNHSPEPFVDFNTKHICRNFEDVRRWAEERQMPEKVPKDALQPPKKKMGGTTTVWSEIP